MSIPVKSFLQRAANVNPPDSVCVDIPLMIRLMEYAREDAKSDMDLHVVAENMTKLSQSKDLLTMQDYEAIIAK